MYSIEELYKLYKDCAYVETDTRKIKSGALFFALKGGNFDGNKYANEALTKGASYAIVDDKTVAVSDKFILVEDVLGALQKLASYHVEILKKKNTKIIGVTGSNGKTTTKEIIALVLSKKYKVNYTYGNLNNHIGVPLTILSFSPETEVGIVEMGANHLGEIGQLCEIAHPDLGIITSIGDAHLEGFKSIEGVRKTKIELFSYVNKNNGVIFVNTNNEHILELHEKYNCEKVFYGNKANLKATFEQGSFYLKANIVDNGCENIINTKLIGNYNLDNLLAGYSIGKYFNIEPNNIVSAMESYEPSNNRSQYIETERNKIFLDAYNANPGSMRAALKSFFEYQENDKAVILGQMNELGSSSKDYHQSIIDLLKETNVVPYLTGIEYLKCNIPGTFKHFRSTSELIEFLKINKLKGKTILIKGSRTNQLESIVDYL